ncbi:hypothetical protein SERLA73DRAFT_178168 [Serpula lacrymans var. lacrymans S7.3]|uniref:Uncharacterized protein n=1 Tax=Serpula lacrymans var. lacrymans (strain S7.3) TaxID=936435 RepID=F8PQV5_SERL3|nr:hypothetical protein SERLA73DRAFT_178168 [Serpula lacrymans var. lacrymans S7.3]
MEGSVNYLLSRVVANTFAEIWSQKFVYHALILGITYLEDWSYILKVAYSISFYEEEKDSCSLVTSTTLASWFCTGLSSPSIIWNVNGAFSYI